MRDDHVGNADDPRHGRESKQDAAAISGLEVENEEGRHVSGYRGGDDQLSLSEEEQRIIVGLVET